MEKIRILFENLFREVKTDSEQQLFEALWSEVCSEYGVNFMPFHVNSQRFFIMDEEEVIGTIEFTKRAPGTFSICEEYFPFEKHEKILKDHSKVYEVGKISIQKKHQRNGHIDKIIECINFHAKTNGVKQYIGFMNLDLYKILLLSYGLRLERLGEVDKQKRHRSVPVLCDVEKSMKQVRKKLIT